MPQQWEYKDYSQLDFPDKIMMNHLDTGTVRIVLADENVLVPVRMGLFNVIIWRAMFVFGIQPSFEDFENVKVAKSKIINNVRLTKVYNKLIRCLPNVPHPLILREICFTVDYFNHWIRRYIGHYMPAIDEMSMSKLTQNPELAALMNTTFNDTVDTRVVELRHKKVGADVANLLRRKDIPNNCLYPYMNVDSLKVNQMVQMICGFGTRSDIDDSIKRGVINESSFSGLKTSQDYGIEHLSAVKAAAAHNDAVPDSSYNGRKITLACSHLQHIYPGSCGNTLTIPFVIPSKYEDNFYGKAIIDPTKNPSLVFLNRKNISDYTDKPVQMVSQLTCRHTDGFCEACAGFAYGHLLKYMPPDMHPGGNAASMFSARVEQQSLSAKHLIKTTTLSYELDPSAEEWLTVVYDVLKFRQEKWGFLKTCSIRIQQDSMSQISDLFTRQLPLEESFSHLTYVDILTENGDVIPVYLQSSNGTIPFLSVEAMRYIKARAKDLIQDDSYCTIDLKKFDFTKPFFRFVLMNDDMFAYVNRVTAFLQNNIELYHDISRCLEDFSNLIYQKSNINIFFLETILRACMITSETDYHIPSVITDIHNVTFGKLPKIITNRSITTELAFEDQRMYLMQPSTYTQFKPIGIYGPFFGMTVPQNHPRDVSWTRSLFTEAVQPLV